MFDAHQLILLLLEGHDLHAAIDAVLKKKSPNSGGERIPSTKGQITVPTFRKLLNKSDSALKRIRQDAQKNLIHGKGRRRTIVRSKDVKRPDAKSRIKLSTRVNTHSRLRGVIDMADSAVGKDRLRAQIKVRRVRPQIHLSANLGDATRKG